MSREIETRIWFKDEAELRARFPLLEIDPDSAFAWKTVFFGMDVLKKGELLRISEVEQQDGKKYSITWKGIDQDGQQLNDRLEIQEEIGIGQTTVILAGSPVEKLAWSPWNTLDDIQEISDVQQPYPRFAAFFGRNKKAQLHGSPVDVKVMQCGVPNWPVLVEFEISCEREDEISAAKQVVLDAIPVDLKERQVLAEPPTLAYEQLFGNRTPLEMAQAQ